MIHSVKDTVTGDNVIIETRLCVKCWDIFTLSEVTDFFRAKKYKFEDVASILFLC